MSGLKVAIPAAQAVSGTAAGLVLTTPIVLGVAAVAVAGIIAYQQAQCIKAKEAEARRIADLQAKWLAEMELAKKTENRRRAAVEAAEAFGALADLDGALQREGLSERRRQKKSVGSTQKGFTDLGPQGPAGAADTHPMYERIMELLGGLPEEFKSDERWPYKRLQEQARRFGLDFEQGRPPNADQLRGFARTLFRTLDRYNRESRTAGHADEERFTAASDLLMDVASSLRLAVTAEHRMELEDIRQRLRSRLATGGPDWSEMEMLKTRSGVLREEVENVRQWRAYRRALADSLNNHLNEMGYETEKQFETEDEPDWIGASLKVPGGERLNIDVGADGRMVFNLVHERTEAHSALTEKEIAFYRVQEDRWSRDFRELIRRLTRDGFQYQVQSEELRDTDAIPIVVAETADEVLAWEEDEQKSDEAPRRRKRE